MNLLFDQDGTLTDPREGIVDALNFALGKLGLPPREPAELTPFIGPPVLDAFQALLSTADPTRIGQALTLFRERYTARGYPANDVYDGIPELLAACRQAGHRLYIATSKRVDFASEVLAHSGLAWAFAQVYGCDVDVSKAELLGQILAERGLVAPDCVMIGDRLHDIEAGRAHGLATVGVLWGYGSREELTAAGADRLIAQPAELLGAIAGLTAERGN